MATSLPQNLTRARSIASYRSGWTARAVEKRDLVNRTVCIRSPPLLVVGHS